MASTVVHVRAVHIGDPDVVYVGRAMPRQGLLASILGNPYYVGRDGTREQCIQAYRSRLLAILALQQRRGPAVYADAIRACQGKRLACWCAPEACHADVIADIADHLDEVLAGLAQELVMDGG